MTTTVPKMTKAQRRGLQVAAVARERGRPFRRSNSTDLADLPFGDSAPADSRITIGHVYWQVVVWLEREGLAQSVTDRVGDEAYSLTYEGQRVARELWPDGAPTDLGPR